MAARTDSRSQENSAPRGAWKRHGVHPPEASSRPSNLFLSASASRSCGTIRANASQPGKTFGLRGASFATMRRGRFVKDSNEHWWDILQEVFRFRVLEKCGVLLQFVGDLVNDETATRRQRLIRFSQQRAFLVDLENAERNAGKNIVAASDAATFELVRQRSCIAMDHMHARIARELPLERPRERCIELEQEQVRIRTHPARNLA